ncbi:MAG TPA: hypothetical protein VH083_22685 [Myxococcales bacterium]|nr:hypothetical protein [Myxococcales bacterium]
MDSISGIAQAGLQAAAAQLDVSARKIARAAVPPSAPSARPAPRNDAGIESRIDGAIVGLSSGTDLVRETINQSAAAVAYRANLATLRTADETQQTLVDVVS